MDLVESSITLLCGELVKLPSYGFRGIVTVAWHGVIIPVRDPVRYDDIIMYDPAEQPFLDEILANPADVTPRLIFADWLEERDDPRAEFIRVQCELAELTAEDERRPAVRKRESELLGTNNAIPHTDLPPSVWSRRYQRGFVERVAMSVSDFVADRKRLFAAAPIRHLHLRQGAGRMRELGECRELQNVTELELGGCEIGDGDLVGLCSSPFLSSLEFLNVANNQLTDTAVSALADSSRLPRLSRLDLSGNREIGNRGLRALGRSATITRLRQLCMNECGFDDDAFLDFIQSTNSLSIEVLTLVGNALSDAAMVGIATSPTLRNLKYLATSSSIDATRSAGISALANSENCRGIQRLIITGDSDDLCLQAIASSECFVSLRYLVISGGDIGDGGVIALAESPRLTQLRRLNLDVCRVTFHGVEQLMRSAHRHPELKVSLNSNSLTSEDRRELHQLFGSSFLLF